jgi:hypothetical protein
LSGTHGVQMEASDESKTTDLMETSDGSKTTDLMEHLVVSRAPTNNTVHRLATCMDNTTVLQFRSCFLQMRGVPLLIGKIIGKKGGSTGHVLSQYTDDGVIATPIRCSSYTNEGVLANSAILGLS